MNDRETEYPDTPDGRYFVVRGRLWRNANPRLDEHLRGRLVRELMSARRAIRDAKGNKEDTSSARKRVDSAKIALGERGPVWWSDGAPDFSRHLVRNTHYAKWYVSLPVS
jgi:hypothetical protein